MLDLAHAGFCIQVACGQQHSAFLLRDADASAEQFTVPLSHMVQRVDTGEEVVAQEVVEEGAAGTSPMQLWGCSSLT